MATMSDATLPRALKTRESRARWATMTTAYQFSTAESIALTEHLLANERAVKYERQGKHELAQKERQAAHRWWRSLKFTSGAARRPGRPSDREWSSTRRGADAA